MCIFKGVVKIGQGQAMTYDLEADALHLWDYWELPEPASQINVSVEELSNNG